MTDEPRTHPINEDDDKPASRGDVRHAQDEIVQTMAKTFDDMATKNDVKALEHRMDQRMDKLESRVDGLATKDDIAAVLEALETNTAAMDRLRDLPARVTRLEQRVFRT